MIGVKFHTGGKTGTLSPEEARRRHERALKDIRNMRPVHKKIAVFLDRWVQENFRTEGGKVGGWRPFARGGRLRRGSGGRAMFDRGARLLQDTGRLRNSFDPFATRYTVGIGSDVSYSETHEKGLGRVPQRRMLPKIGEVRDDVGRLYRKHAADGFRRQRIDVQT